MRLLILALFCGVVLAGCGSTITARDRVIMPGQIENWQSYAWESAPASLMDAGFAQADRAIRSKIDEQLMALGYRKVSKNSADFLVNHSIYAHFEPEKISDREQRAMRDTEILDRSTNTGSGGIDHTQGEGFLRLIMSRPDGKLVWEGQVESALNYRGQGEKKIDMAVRRLLANFPDRTN